jgi:hypothetical protein
VSVAIEEVLTDDGESTIRSQCQKHPSLRQERLAVPGFGLRSNLEGNESVVLAIDALDDVPFSASADNLQQLIPAA